MSGFKVIPLQSIIDALAEMEARMREETGLDQDALEDALDRLEDLVGTDEAMTMDLDEIISWIKAFDSK